MSFKDKLRNYVDEEEGYEEEYSESETIEIPVEDQAPATKPPIRPQRRNKPQPQQHPAQAPSTRPPSRKAGIGAKVQSMLFGGINQQSFTSFMSAVGILMLPMVILGCFIIRSPLKYVVFSPDIFPWVTLGIPLILLVLDVCNLDIRSFLNRWAFAFLLDYSVYFLFVVKLR